MALDSILYNFGFRSQGDEPGWVKRGPTYIEFVQPSDIPFRGAKGKHFQLSVGQICNDPSLDSRYSHLKVGFSMDISLASSRAISELPLLLLYIKKITDGQYCDVPEIDPKHSATYIGMSTAGSMANGVVGSYQINSGDTNVRFVAIGEKEGVPTVYSAIIERHSNVLSNGSQVMAIEEKFPKGTKLTDPLIVKASNWQKQVMQRYVLKFGIKNTSLSDLSLLWNPPSSDSFS
ncbi:hypothetical protein HOC01_04890 [archaeon]|jgi:hypothetical protein|nr:hypothetical protein [archaeon]MBT6698304.1 hypothetical protein [archaeon]